MYSDTTEISKSSTLAIQQDLAKIGITVKLVPQDFDVLLGTITVPHQAPLVFIGWFQDFPDPSDFFDPILSCATAVPARSTRPATATRTSTRSGRRRWPSRTTPPGSPNTSRSRRW